MQLEVHDKVPTSSKEKEPADNAHVLANETCFELTNNKGNFLSNLLQEVSFRKQNDFGYDFLVNRGKAQKTVRDRLQVNRERYLRSQTRIGDFTGSQNEGSIINSNLGDAFVRRRKTREIEQVKLSRLEELNRTREASPEQTKLLNSFHKAAKEDQAKY